MHIIRSNKRFFASFLSLAILLLSLHTPIVNAAIVPTSSLIIEQQSQEQRQILLQRVSKAEAQELLLSFGVTPEMAEQRIQAMTTEELAQLNNKFENLPAGQGILGTVIVVFVVLIVLDLLGTTDIFPAIKPIN